MKSITGYTHLSSSLLSFDIYGLVDTPDAVKRNVLNSLNPMRSRGSKLLTWDDLKAKGYKVIKLTIEIV